MSRVWRSRSAATFSASSTIRTGHRLGALKIVASHGVRPERSGLAGHAGRESAACGAGYPAALGCRGLPGDFVCAGVVFARWRAAVVVIA